MDKNSIVTPDGKDDGRPDVVVVSEDELRRESARIAAIRARIAGITSLPEQHAGDHSVAISIVLARLGMMTVMEDEFGEFTEEARTAVDTTRSALETLRNAKRGREAEEQEREIEQRAAAKIAAQNATQDRQRHGAMNVIRSLQQQGAKTGSATELQAAIDAVAAQSITEEDFGMATSMVKMAQGMALDTLRRAYERAVIDEAATQLKRAVTEEYGALTDAADAQAEPEAPTARDLAIAEAVREAAQKAMEGVWGNSIAADTAVTLWARVESLDLPSIIATVKEQQ